MAPRSRPITDRVSQPAALKWVAGIVAAVVGALIVMSLAGTAKAMISQSERLAVVETKAEARDETLARIETAVGTLDAKLDRLAARPAFLAAP